MSRLITRHGLRAAMAGAALLCLGATAGQAAIPATLAVQGALGPDHRDTGGGTDRIVNMRATIRNVALDNLHQEDLCGVVTIGRDGVFGVLLGESFPVVLPFDEQYSVLIDACHDENGCDGITNVDECDPDDRVQVVVMLDPVAYAHRAREAESISATFLLNGDVAGPYFNLQLQPDVVGTPEIADGSVTLPKLGFDPVTQPELDAEAAARIAGDAAEAAARDAAIAAEAAARDAAIAAEAAAREAADAAEATARVSADAAEALARANADATEAATRAAADTAEANARVAADASEAAARAAADTAETNARLAADASEATARANGDIHAGDVAGPNTNLQIQSGAVRSAEIQDATIKFEDLAPNGAADRDYIRWEGSEWDGGALGDIGNNSSAGGRNALRVSTGGANTAFGYDSQQSTSSGLANTSVGAGTLERNTTGDRNVAVGSGALAGSVTGDGNVAIGSSALNATTGSFNIAIGTLAGNYLTNGDDNIYVGSSAALPNESGVIRIGESQNKTYLSGVRSATISGWSVVVDASGRLGTSGAAPASDTHAGDVAGPSSNLEIQRNSVGSFEVDNDSLGAADIGDGLGVSEIDESAFQRRVIDSCPAGKAIRSIDVDGSVTCEAPAATGFVRVHAYAEVPPLDLFWVLWTCTDTCMSGGMRMTGNVMTEAVHFVNNGGYFDPGGAPIPFTSDVTEPAEKWFSTVYNASLITGRWVDFSVMEQD